MDSPNTVVIGFDPVTVPVVQRGYKAEAIGDGSVAIGSCCRAVGTASAQIGQGENTTPETLQFLSAVKIGGKILLIADLPSAHPGVGSKQFWADPDDGDRVKYAR